MKNNNFLLAIGFWFLLPGNIVSQNNIQRLLVLPIGHTDAVYSAVFSRDGDRVITTSYDNTTKIWDVQSGAFLMSFTGNCTAELSYDGSKLLTFSGDSTLIWDIKSGAILKKLRAIGGKVNSAVFSSDGSRVLTAHDDSFARIWDTETGAELIKLDGHRGSILTALFSPDGCQIVTASGDGTAKIWDSETGKCVNNLNKHKKTVYRAVFSTNGLRIATSSEDKTVKIWDALSGTLLDSLEEEGERVVADFSRDNCYLVTTSPRGKTKVRNAESREIIRTLDGGFENISPDIFSKDGKFILSVSPDFTTEIRRVESGELTDSFPKHAEDIFSASFSPDGQLIVTSSWDKTSKIWDVKSGMLLHSLDGHAKNVTSADFSSDGKYLVITSRENIVRLWDIERGTFLGSIKDPTCEFTSAVFSPDGAKIATGSYGDTDKVWKIDSLKVLCNLPKGDNSTLKSPVFSQDGKSVLTSARDNTVVIFDAEKGVELKRLKCHTSLVTCADFSSDNHRLVTASIDKTALIWNAKKGIPKKKLEGHTNIVTLADLSPDNRMVLTVSCDTAIVWDVKRGKRKWSLDSFGNYVNYAKFSQDGSQIIIGSENKLTIWNTGDRSLFRSLPILGNLFAVDFSKKRFISHENALLHLYDLNSGKLLYSFVAIDSSDYLILHPDGFYDGTEAARKLLYFVCNGEVIELAQLKDALYMPKLAEKIVAGLPIYAEKLSEQDICDVVPRVKPTDQQGYHYKIIPRRSGLERVEVYVNDKRVRTLPVSELTQTEGAYEVTLNEEELSSHFISGVDNKVKVVGVARYKLSSELLSRGIIKTAIGTGAKTVPRLFAVMIGINDYKDPSLRLNFPVKDALDLGRVLEASAVKMLGRENVFIYPINSNVKPGTGFDTPEKEGIRRALEDIGRKARPEDVVFLFFAGHGQMQGVDGKVFTFLTADASQLNPVGISTKELQEWLSFEGPHKMRANKTILIFDACNSGQATAELLAMARTDDETRRLRQVEDLKDKSGMFILAGAAPNQSAYELQQYEHGLLTYSLLSVMKNNPEILEDSIYLNLQKWFLDTEKTLKNLADKEGLKQDAKPLGTANIRMGIVDKEITDQIVLVNQKPKVYCDNVLDIETLGDDLLLKEKINSSLSAISERDGSGEILFTTMVTPDVYGINILYQILGDNVTANLRLAKGEKTIFQTRITDSKNDMDGLVKRIVKEVRDNVK